MNTFLRISVTERGGAHVVTFRDSIVTDHLTIAQEFSAFTESESPRIVVDFSGVRTFTYDVLLKFIEFHEEVKRLNGVLVICCMDTVVQNFFEAHLLHVVFSVAQSQDEALEMM